MRQLFVLACAALVMVACGGPQPTKPAEHAPKPEPQTWRYTSTMDKMTGRPQGMGCVTSNETVHLQPPYGDVTADLCLRSDPRTDDDVFLVLNGAGQFVCSPSQPCQLTVRFDQEDARTMEALAPSDGSTNILLFAKPLSLVLMQIGVTKAKSVAIEAEYYQAGSQVLTFNTAGYEFRKVRFAPNGPNGQPPPVKP